VAAAREDISCQIEEVILVTGKALNFKVTVAS
jgi:hypothetical protein